MFKAPRYICPTIVCMILITSVAAPVGAEPDTRVALHLFQEQKWEQCAAAYKQIVKTNPNRGDYWSNYGFALHNLKQYDDARAAFQRQADLGFQPATALYNIACGYALSDNKAAALKWLGKALDRRFVDENTLRTDTDLDAIRDDPEFKRITGLASPDGLSRDEQWRYDLDHLVRRMEKVHYNLYGRVSREQFASAVADLKARIPKLKDHQIIVGLRRLLAMVGDGHTALGMPTEGKYAVTRYPVEFYLFSDGLFVRGAAPDVADALGGRVVKIGKVTADQALKAATPLCSIDNPMGIKLWAPRMLALPAVLDSLALVEDMNHVPLVVEKPGGEQATVTLKPVPMTGHGHGYVIPSDFVFANSRAQAPKPLYLENTADEYWYKYLEKEKLVYCQYNAVQNKHDEPLAQFWARLFKFVNDSPVEYLVIDMRHNGGGNNYLNKPLIHGLIKCEKINRPGHLFVITGRQTFSAAMNGAVDLERNTEAIFAGEPTGSSPNFVGESTMITLPCSGLKLSCSSLYWQSSVATDQRIWIAPTIAAELSSSDYAANRDPVMDSIREYISKSDS